jgi:hypothetical protein
MLTEIDAVNLLQNVTVSSTRWSTVFNLNTKQILIAMGGNFENLHHFSIH